MMKRYRCINGANIDTVVKDIMYGDCSFRVEVGTTGQKGGDSGHGSRTYIRLVDLSNSDVTISKISTSFSEGGFEIAAGGDWEYNALRESIAFILEELNKPKPAR